MISDYPINKTATTAPLIDLKGEAFRGEQLIWTNGPVFLRGALSADGSMAWSAKAAKCDGPELRRRKRFPRRVFIKAFCSESWERHVCHKFFVKNGQDVKFGRGALHRCS